MPIAPIPHSNGRDLAAELRALMTEHGLTQREVAAIACVSLKAVESWLADPKSANHRRLAPRHMQLIKMALPGFLAARRTRKE